MSRRIDGFWAAGGVMAAGAAVALLSGCGSGRPHSQETAARPSQSASRTVISSPGVSTPAESSSDVPVISSTTHTLAASSIPSPLSSSEQRLATTLNAHAATLARQLANQTIRACVESAPARCHYSLQDQGHEIKLSLRPPDVHGRRGEVQQSQLCVTLAKYAGQRGLSLLALPVESVGIETDTLLARNSRSHGRHFTTFAADLVNTSAPGHWAAISLGTANSGQWQETGDFSQAPAVDAIHTVQQLDAIGQQTEQFIADAIGGRFIGFANPPYTD